MKSSARLAMILFLSSEVMLFGSLFAVLVALEAGSPGFHREARHLNFWSGFAATALLLFSSALIHYNRIITFLLAAAFLILKGFTWNKLCQLGLLPSSSNFWGMFFLMTGLHALHLVGGMAALFFRPGQRSPALELYWHFVDLVWITLFVAFYVI